MATFIGRGRLLHQLEYGRRLTFTSADDRHAFRLDGKCQPEHGPRRTVCRVGAVRRGRQSSPAAAAPARFNSNVAWIGNQPASSYKPSCITPENCTITAASWAAPNRVPSLTMTTTGISAAAVTGATYTATIQYANVSWSNANVNPSANVALNILANGVVVGTGTLSGLAQNSPWTPVTATWTADRGLRWPGDPAPGGGDQLPRGTGKHSTVAGANALALPMPR